MLSIPLFSEFVNFQAFVILAFLLSKVNFGPSSYLPQEDMPTATTNSANE